MKRKLSTSFYPQTDSQIEQQKSTIEVYFRVFVNFEPDDWGRLLPIAKFVYNNAKNTSTGCTHFQLNCGYHPQIYYKEDIDSPSKSKITKKLLFKLCELMTICQEKLHYA